MALLKQLFSYGPKYFILTLLSSLIAGLSCTYLVTLINEMLQSGFVITELLIIKFGVSLLLFFALGLVSEQLLTTLSNNLLHDLRLQLSSQILHSPLPHLESLNSHQLLAILTEDIHQLRDAMADLPGLGINLAIVMGCYAYIFTLSPTLFGMVSAFMGLIFSIYLFPVRYSQRYLLRYRSLSGQLYQHFESLIYGIKQLLINPERAAYFFNNHLKKDSNSLRVDFNRFKFLHRAALRSIDTLILLGVGLSLFLLPTHLNMSKEVLSSFIIIILFLLAPLRLCLNYIEKYLRATKSLSRLNSLQKNTPEKNQRGDLEIFKGPTPQKFVTAPLHLRELTYQYPNSSFSLGPLTLTLDPHNITFITGGNGSGKTTLLKLITGLYAPDSGTVSYGDTPITPENQKAFQNQFGAVFSDLFLFDTPYQKFSPEKVQLITQYLKEFQLDQLVSFDQNGFSSTKVSQGQKKRLALIMELALDKAIYVFDEWAADQDPEFRAYFYEVILKNLKAEGKMVIAITHDEGYFGVADQMIKL